MEAGAQDLISRETSEGNFEKMGLYYTGNLFCSDPNWYLKSKKQRKKQPNFIKDRKYGMWPLVRPARGLDTFHL